MAFEMRTEGERSRVPLTRALRTFICSHGLAGGQLHRLRRRTGASDPTAVREPEDVGGS